MIRNFSLIYYSFLCSLIISTKALACTVLLQGDGNNLFAANNEDSEARDAYFHVIPPSETNKYGYAYFSLPLANNPKLWLPSESKGNSYPQGGINDQGLFYDITAQKPFSKMSHSAELLTYKGFFILHLLANARDVYEVMNIASQYKFIGLERAQVMFGDKYGNSLVLTSDEKGNLKKIWKNVQNSWQVIVNFRLFDLVNNTTDRRYVIAQKHLSQQSKVGVASLFELLEEVSFSSGPYTTYSSIYDLRKQIIYLVFDRQFYNVKKIDLQSFFKDGQRRYKLSKLFATKL